MQYTRSTLETVQQKFKWMRLCARLHLIRPIQEPLDVRLPAADWGKGGGTTRGHRGGNTISCWILIVYPIVVGLTSLVKFKLFQNRRRPPAVCIVYLISKRATGLPHRRRLCAIYILFQNQPAGSHTIDGCVDHISYFKTSGIPTVMTKVWSISYFNSQNQLDGAPQSTATWSVYLS